MSESSKIKMQRAMKRRDAAQAVEGLDIVAAAVAAHPGGDGEGGDLGEAVDDQVKQHCSGGGLVIPVRGDGDHADQDIAGMGDGRVGQHPLQPALGESGQVPEGHGDGRDDGEQADPAGAHAGC